jgi:hypothetical protein
VVKIRRKVPTVVFTVFKILLALACGLVLGWFLDYPFCYIAMRIDNSACGHNAFIWLPLLIPIGIVISWYMLSQIQRRFSSSKARSAQRNSDDG